MRLAKFPAFGYSVPTFRSASQRSTCEAQRSKAQASNGRFSDGAPTSDVGSAAGERKAEVWLRAIPEPELAKASKGV